MFKMFCEAAQSQRINPVDTKPKRIPRIHQRGDDNQTACIKGLTQNIALDIIENHPNSANSWENQIDKVKCL